ncbi:MAG: ECF-type sigma factor [Gemmatimonadaceae bacterium]
MTTSLQPLLDRAERGDRPAADQLFAAMYDDLRRLAEQHLHRAGDNCSLGTTTLLHEAYLNIAERGGLAFPDRARFMGYASRAMRGLLIDYARSRRAQKRGGEFHITQAGDDTLAGAAVTDTQLTLLSDALEELAALEPSLAQLVDLHFFCGFSFVEISELREVSERTVQRDWRKARLLLNRALADAEKTS